MIGALVLFLGGFIYTLIMIGKQAADSDTNSIMGSQIINIVITNTVLIAILGFVSLLWAQSNEGLKIPYIYVISHLALLISIISASVSTVTKMNAPATTATG